MKKWVKRIAAVALAVWAAWNVPGITHEMAEPIWMPPKIVPDSPPKALPVHWLEEIGFADGGW